MYVDVTDSSVPHGLQTANLDTLAEVTYLMLQEDSELKYDVCMYLTPELASRYRPASVIYQQFSIQQRCGRRMNARFTREGRG